MAPPTSSASRIVTLLLKVFNFVLLLISLIVLTTNTATAYTEVLTFKVYACYECHWIRIYPLTNCILNFSHYNGKSFNKRDGGALLDFYGDKVISYLLATGAAAGFGVTVDLKETFGLFIDRSFYEKAYASASLLLLAFVCTAILSVISSYAVPKKV
ncbi:casp-like protein 4d1 [Quercus suber]|uniref:CASP-like protein n=1 Tax=Quercus suber TaxID=58331 RepID=A0AAW0JYG4_QUESU